MRSIRLLGLLFVTALLLLAFHSSQLDRVAPQLRSERTLPQRHSPPVLSDPPPPPPPPRPTASGIASQLSSYEAANRTHVHVTLPRNAACLELEDIRNAHASCQARLERAPQDATARRKRTALACSRSVESHCVDPPGKVTQPQCEPSGHAPPLPLDWSSVVFGIATHDSAVEARLLQAAADTWLLHVRGADLVIVTDVDDPRDATDIAPKTSGGVRVHVHRCAECRSAKCSARKAKAEGCEGVREGWLARRKVLHMFAAMESLFVTRADGGGADAAAGSVRSAPLGGAPKLFFVKVDPDTVPVPHNLHRLLTELVETLGSRQPVYFGMAACRVKSFGLCHGAGGAGYGLSRAALVELAAFVRAEYPGFLERVDKFTYGGEDVTVAYALKRRCGTSVLNVGCMYQHPPLKYAAMPCRSERAVGIANTCPFDHSVTAISGTASSAQRENVGFDGRSPVPQRRSTSSRTLTSCVLSTAAHYTMLLAARAQRRAHSLCPSVR
jgi:hypothetical protein